MGCGRRGSGRSDDGRFQRPQKRDPGKATGIGADVPWGSRAAPAVGCPTPGKQAASAASSRTSLRPGPLRNEISTEIGQAINDLSIGARSYSRLENDWNVAREWATR